MGAQSHSRPRSWHPGVVATVDTAYVDQSVPIEQGGYGAVGWTALELQGQGVSTRPVVRLDSPPRALAEAAGVVAMCGQGVCLRITGPGAEPSSAFPAAATDRLITAMAVDPSAVHLVIDLGGIDASNDVDLAAMSASGLLSDATGRGGARRTVPVAPSRDGSGSRDQRATKRPRAAHPPGMSNFAQPRKPAGTGGGQFGTTPRSEAVGTHLGPAPSAPHRPRGWW